MPSSTILPRVTHALDFAVAGVVAAPAAGALGRSTHHRHTHATHPASPQALLSPSPTAELQGGIGLLDLGDAALSTATGANWAVSPYHTPALQLRASAGSNQLAAMSTPQAITI